MPKLLVAVLAVLGCLCNSAFAERRVALVVGNSAYQYVARLDNPKNDARLMADTLRAAGFTVIGGGALIDLDKAGFDGAVQNFGSQLQGADVGLFYYAGHGIQLRGTNYLVPVSANPTREADVDFQMLDVALVLRQMEGSGTKLNLVILDACRNNPFGGRSLRATVGGLAQMQAPEGTLISYATQPGNVAQDGTDDDSPYTKALAQTIRRPGLGIFDAFNEVGLAVKRTTGGTQQPWVSSSPIDGTFYFTAPAVATPAPAATLSADETAWSFLRDTKDPEQLRRFVEQFPASPHRSEAAAKITVLQPLKMAAAPSGPAESAQDNPAPPPSTEVAPPAATSTISAPRLGKSRSVKLEYPTLAVSFTPDGQKIMALVGLNELRIVDPERGVTIRSFPLEGVRQSSLYDAQNSIYNVVFSPDNRWIAAWNKNSHVLLWDTATGRIVHTFETEGAPLAFSSDGRRLFTTAGRLGDTTVQIWDVGSGSAIRTLDPQRDLPTILNYVVVSENARLAMVHHNDNVSLWDTGSGKKLRVFKASGVPEADLISIAISPDGRWLAVGGGDRGGDKMIRIWEVRTGKLRTLVGHSGKVSWLAFSPDGRQLASSSDDKTLKLWDVETGRVIQSVTQKVGSLLYSHDGRRLAVWPLGDQAVTIWPLEPASAVAGK